MRFLARKRTTFTWFIPLCLLITACCVGKFRLAEGLLGALLLVLGEIVRFWAAGCIQKDNVIATTGPYAYVRNPLYFGSFLLALGYAFLSGLGILSVAIVLALFLAFHMAAIATEEEWLTKAFGETYIGYKRHVPRLIPRLLPYRVEGEEPMRFSWKQAVYNREPTTALITFVTALAFAVIQFYHRQPW